MMDLTNPSAGVEGGISLDDALSVADSYDEENEQEQQNDSSEGEDQSQDYDQDQDDDDEESNEGGDEEIEHDGKKYKVPKALKDSFLRQSDYTQKTQTLAEQRKAIEQHAQNLVAEREYYANQLGGFVEQLASQIQQLPSDAELLELSRTNPAAYLQVKAERDFKINQIQQAQQAKNYLSQQQQYEQQRNQQAMLANEHSSLLNKLPAWKDAKIAAKEQTDISSYLKTEGFSSDDISGLVDHKALIVARKAMLYDRMIAGNAKQQNQQPNKQRIKSLPAVNQGKSNPRVEKKVVDRFKRSGSIDDALSILNKLSGD